ACSGRAHGVDPSIVLGPVGAGTIPGSQFRGRPDILHADECAVGHTPASHVGCARRRALRRRVGSEGRGAHSSLLSHPPIGRTTMPDGPDRHVPIEPSTLYVGNAAMLLCSRNPDGTDNLAPA